MKSYTLTDEVNPHIHLQGGKNGLVPYLALGRVGSDRGTIVAVSKDAVTGMHGNAKLGNNCSINRLDDGRIEIGAGVDDSDKRLLVLVRSSICIVHHSLDDVEVVLSHRLDHGSKDSLVVVEPGARIPMMRNAGTIRHSRYEHFVFHNNDGQPEIVPVYTLPEPIPAESKGEKVSTTQSKNTQQKGWGGWLFLLGIFVGMALAGVIQFSQSI